MITWEKHRDMFFGRLNNWGLASLHEVRGYRRGWRLEVNLPTGTRTETHADQDLLKKIAEEELRAFLDRAGLTLKNNSTEE